MLEKWYHGSQRYDSQLQTTENVGTFNLFLYTSRREVHHNLQNKFLSLSPTLIHLTLMTNKCVLPLEDTLKLRYH